MLFILIFVVPFGILRLILKKPMSRLVSVALVIPVWVGTLWVLHQGSPGVVPPWPSAGAVAAFFILSIGKKQRGNNADTSERGRQ